MSTLCAGRYEPDSEEWECKVKTEKKIDIPENLSLEMLRHEFGIQAVSFYQNRIADRQAEGRIYYNPMKTIYIWATQDRRTNQGFYSSYKGYASCKKKKNFGRT